MRTLKILSTLLIMGSLLVLFSCKGGGSASKPSDVVKDMISNLEKGNYDKVIDVIDLEGKALDEESKTKLKGILSLGKAEIDKKKGIKSMEVLEETVAEDGNSATVKMKLVYGDNSEDTPDYKTSKVDGKWKVKMK